MKTPISKQLHDMMIEERSAFFRTMIGNVKWRCLHIQTNLDDNIFRQLAQSITFIVSDTQAAGKP